MKIRWMIAARAIRQSPNPGGGLDIAGVFDKLRVDKFPARDKFIVLACVDSEPTDDVGQKIELRFRLPSSKHQLLFEGYIPYDTFTYQEWLEGAAPYFYLPLDAEFPEEDVYFVELGTEDKILARAWFTVTLKQEAVR